MMKTNTKVLGISMPLDVFLKSSTNEEIRALLERALKSSRVLEYYEGRKVSYTLRVDERLYNRIKQGAELNNMSIKEFTCELLAGVDTWRNRKE